MRLIRKNCRYCAQPYEPEPHIMKSVPMAERENAQFRRGAGCEQCLNTGYCGPHLRHRTAQGGSASSATAVMDKVPTRALQDIAISQGMQTMWQRGSAPRAVRRNDAGRNPARHFGGRDLNPTGNIAIAYSFRFTDSGWVELFELWADLLALGGGGAFPSASSRRRRRRAPSPARLHRAQTLERLRR